MRNFIGRAEYLKDLNSLWGEHASKIAALYGRRRVGKSELIRQFSKDKPAWIFEAIEGEDTPGQVTHFLSQLSDYLQEPHLRDLRYRDWPAVFELLSAKLAEQKALLLAFDELSWMAAGRSKLVSYIKYYWDQKWKYHPHLLFILCGSVASWMVKNVVKSNALYGRVSKTILVEPLSPNEVSEFIGKKRGQKEVLEYLLLFSGIPRYLEEFDFNRSIELNIEQSCFKQSGFFVEEADRIFYNQFKETALYKRIVNYLQKGPLTLSDIAEKLHLPSSGGLKSYLDNLIAAGIVDKLPDIRDFRLSKHERYFLVDEFLRFHAHFIAPNMREIKASSAPARFSKFTRGKWHPFMGYAFERFCMKQRYRIAAQLGFEDKVLGCGPYLDPKKEGVQYDLVFLRSDRVITCCEAKYFLDPPGPKLIAEMETKLKRSIFPSGASIERVLIANCDPSAALKDSGYFHAILNIHGIIRIE